jgi:hypothetical protein
VTLAIAFSLTAELPNIGRAAATYWHSCGGPSGQDIDLQEKRGWDDSAGDEDVSLDAVLALMPERTQVELIVLNAKSRFSLGELDASLPQLLVNFPSFLRIVWHKYMRHLNQQRPARKYPRSSLHAKFRLAGAATT